MELYPKNFYTRAHDEQAVSPREDKQKAKKKKNTIRWDVCSPQAEFNPSYSVQLD